MKQENKKKQSAVFKNRLFKSGSLTLLLCLAAVLITVMVNLLVRSLPEKYTEFDFSENKIYTLSSKTKTIAAALQQDVVLYHVVRPGAESLMVSELLQKYEAESKHIRCETVDPVANPAFIKNYTEAPLTENSIIVVSGSRYKIITLENMFRITYDMEVGQPVQVFDGEAQLTSAIGQVTGKKRPVVYVLAGHGEYPLEQSFLNIAEKENYILRDLQLLSAGGVPEDAALVLAAESGVDISEQERKYLETYLAEGGSLLLMTDYSNGGYPNWEVLGRSYGLSLLNGIAVEQDGSRALAGYPTFVLPYLYRHPITEGMMGANQLYLIAAAQGIEMAEQLPEGVQVSRLMTTSEKSYLAVEGEEKPSVMGPFCLAAAAEKSDHSKLVWISSTSLLNSMIDSQVSGANSDFLMNTMNWLSNRDEKSSIRPKNLFTNGFAVSSTQVHVWSIVLIVLVPVLILLIGAVIVLRRRKR